MKTMTQSIRRSVLTAAILGLTAASIQAALISWGAAQNITGDSDVSTAGTLVGALNLGSTGVANTTVNGVTFTGVGVPTLTTNTITSGNFTLSIATAFVSTNAAGSGLAPFSSLSAPYQALLSSHVGSQGVNVRPFTLTMSGLVTGQTYQFEWWCSNSPASTNFITTATAGGVVALGSNPSSASGGIGQFAIGTFIADATNQQAITFAAGSGVALLNGFQLRQTSVVPEPGTALFGLALCGVAGLRRRR